jgi:hypothetical protein
MRTEGIVALQILIHDRMGVRFESAPRWIVAARAGCGRRRITVVGRQSRQTPRAYAGGAGDWRRRAFSRGGPDFGPSGIYVIMNLSGD